MSDLADQPDSTKDYVPAEGPGTRLGAYKLLQQIGGCTSYSPVRRRFSGSALSNRHTTKFCD